jgi:hypothetical protein
VSEPAAENLSPRRIEASDWPVVHTRARRPETRRSQPWGPNCEEARECVASAAAAWWDVELQAHHASLALVDGREVGSGEVTVRHAQYRHGEISSGLHPSVRGRGRSPESAGKPR